MSLQDVEFHRRGEWRQPRQFGPDDVRGFSEEVRQAMKLLEPLLQANLLVVHPDRWSAGRLCFMRPRVARLQGWVPHVPQPDGLGLAREKSSFWRVGGVKNFLLKLF